MVDVGGFRLSLSCSGESEPPVVLISGSGAIAATWEIVQAGISRFTRVCAYDRAGFGASDPGPIPSTLSDRAEQLSRLLENAGLKSPLVLVGMSYGGLIARAFHYHHAEKVCGMVMVDVLEESFGYRPEFAERVARGREEILANVRKARFGLMHLWLLKHREVVLPEAFSDDSQRQFRASFARSKFWRAVLDDADSMRRSESVVRKFGSLGNVPLVVLRHGKDDPTLVLPTMTPPQAEEAWRIAQNNLAALSSNSLLLVAPNSRHNIMFDEPERVTEAVRIVVEAVRQNRRVEDIAAHA